MGLDFNRVRVDYLEFQDGLQTIGRQPWLIQDESPLPEPVLEQLKQAASLWRSAHFLEGVQLPASPILDDWLTITEQNSYHRRDRILHRLISHYIAGDDFDAALFWLEKALEIDQINEELHILKLETLSRSGQRTEALRYGQFVQDLFTREYNEQPSGMFSAVLQRIKTEQSQENHTRDLAEQKISSDGPRFIGREGILREMTQAYQRGLVIFIEGEIGSGKTRLVHEFYKRLKPAPRLLVAPCHPSTSGIPYRPLIELIRTSVSPQELAGLGQVDQDWLAQMDPSFFRVNTVSDSNPVFNSDNLPRIHEAVYHLFRQISNRQKPFFMLDNAHASDEATISTFRIMLQNHFLDGAAALVITAEKATRNPALQRFLDELAQVKHLKRISLPALSPAEIEELAAQISHTRLDKSWLAYIQTQLGGNPLMIIESLRAMDLQSMSTGQGEFQPQIPVSIRAALREQFVNLSPVMQTLASLTAIAEPSAMYDIIESASQLSPDEVVDGLEELEKTGILVSATDHSGRGLVYSFAQKVFHNVVLLEMSATRKRLLHRRLAAAIEASHSQDLDSYAAILASHYEAGGDLEKAFHTWLRTAMYARRLGAPGDADTAFRRANGIVEAVEIQLDDSQILEFYRNWAEIAYTTHNPEALIKIHDWLMNLGGKRSSALLMGTGLEIQSLAHFSRSQFAEGQAVIDQALRYFKDSGNLAEWLRCVSRKAKFLYMLNHLKEAGTTLETALAVIPEGMDEPVLQARALLHYDYASVLTLMGYPKRSVEQAEKSLRYYVQAHDVEGQAKVYGILVMANGFCGETVKAESEGEIGLQLANRIQYARMQAYIHVYMAMVKVCRGKMDEAWQHVNESLQISEKFGYPELVALSLRTMGDIFRYLDNNETAIQYYRKAYDASGESFAKYDILARLGFLSCVAGDEASGLQMIQDARDETDRIGMGSVSISCRVYLWMVQKQLPELEAILPELEGLTRDSLERGLLAQWGVGMGLLARLDYFNQRPDQAVGKINEMIRRGNEFEGLWASLLFQILHDQQNSWNDLFYEEWRQLVRGYIDQMDLNCRHPLLRPSFEAFVSSIDKNDGERLNCPRLVYGCGV